MSAELKCCSATATCSIKDGPKLVRGHLGDLLSPPKKLSTPRAFFEDVAAAKQFERDLVRLDEIAESDEADPYDVLKEALEGSASLTKRFVIADRTRTVDPSPC